MSSPNIIDADKLVPVTDINPLLSGSLEDTAGKVAGILDLLSCLSISEAGPDDGYDFALYNVLSLMATTLRTQMKHSDERGYFPWKCELHDRIGAKQASIEEAQS